MFTGVLRPGGKVPIDDVAEMLGVSRQPVREALIELAHDGLVTVEGRRGTFVAEFGPDVIRDHYELYGLLQGFAVRRVVANADASVAAALRAIVAEADTTDDVAELTRLSIEFSRTINRASGNDRLKRVIGAMARFTPGEYYLGEISEAVERNRATMREQLDAIESGDADRAADATMRGWMRTSDDLIAHLAASGVFR